MSFFQEEQNDSNLQYDDTAFLYFIASALIVASLVITYFILKQLSQLKVPNEKHIAKNPIYFRQLERLRADNRKKVFSKSLWIKLAFLAICVYLTYWTYLESSKGANKLKGFDPFQILGVTPQATLRQIKKAYRALAMQYHPDKNVGNPQAQTKFILISKSYECFTNEEKKVNCFKYGNPDGAQAHRVGIGLPNFFIKTDYQYIVLPIVLAIFLIVIPAFFLRWSNQNSSMSVVGLKMQSMIRLIKYSKTSRNIFSGVYQLACYKQLFQNFGFSPITQEQQSQLEQAFVETPMLKTDYYDEMDNQQRKVLWQLVRYMSGKSEFSHPQYHVKFQECLLHALKHQIAVTNRQVCEQIPYGNPDWKIQFQGFQPVQVLLHCFKDYYNRSLTILDKSIVWTQVIGLTEEEMQITKRNPIANFYMFLCNPSEVMQYVQLFPEKRKGFILQQLKNIPVFHLDAKLKVADQTVTQVTSYDYPELYFKVTKRNDYRFCPLNSYHYPKTIRLFIFAVLQNEIVSFKTLEITSSQKRQFILKQPIRFGQVNSKKVIDVYLYSDCYVGMDLRAQVQITVSEPTEEMRNRKVVFHPDDMNLQQRKKSYLEEAMDLQLSPQDNMLSDSDEEQELQKS